jgi:hypothetical protein
VRDLWADRLELRTAFVSACFAAGADPDPDIVDQWLREIMLLATEPQEVVTTTALSA